jgi:hypothetical protein
MRINRFFGIFVAILCCSVLTSIGANLTNIQTFASSKYDPSDFYDEECADRMFDKYEKDAEPEYDKYLDKAEQIPLPYSESDINNYLDSLDPLAEEYIDNLDPYADEYIKNLDDCLK